MPEVVVRDVVTRGDFLEGLLRFLDYPVTRHNRVALVSWITAEGGPSLDDSFDPEQARFNPLNTTQPMPGATAFNSVGVRNYVSLAQGIEATAKTLLFDGHGYRAIRRHLRRNHHPARTLRAVERSDWGTGGLALRVLPGVRDHYSQYAAKPIGQ
jgi:hypothetical protein